MSNKSVAERLQVKGTRKLAVIEPPSDVGQLVEPASQASARALADVILTFAADRDALDKALPSLLADAQRNAIVWLAYPKLTSKLAVNLNRDIIRNFATRSGIYPVSQIAIDENWSALRLKIGPRILSEEAS